MRLRFGHARQSDLRSRSVAQARAGRHRRREGLERCARASLQPGQQCAASVIGWGTMRPGFGQFNVATPEYLRFSQQFGATDVLLNTPLLPGGHRWELADLVKLRLS